MIENTPKCKACAKINDFKPWLLMFQLFSLTMFIWGCIECTKWILTFF